MNLLLYVCAYFVHIIMLLELLLLLLLLLLFVVVHLPPEVFFIQQQYLPSTFSASCTNERSLLLKYTPWRNSRFCAASALPVPITSKYFFIISLCQYGHARSHRRASARRGEAPLVLSINLYNSSSCWGRPYYPPYGARLPGT